MRRKGSPASPLAEGGVGVGGSSVAGSVAGSGLHEPLKLRKLPQQPQGQPLGKQPSSKRRHPRADNTVSVH